MARVLHITWLFLCLLEEAASLSPPVIIPAAPPVRTSLPASSAAKVIPALGPDLRPSMSVAVHDATRASLRGSHPAMQAPVAAAIDGQQQAETNRMDHLTWSWPTFENAAPLLSLAALFAAAAASWKAASKRWSLQRSTVLLEMKTLDSSMADQTTYDPHKSLAAFGTKGFGKPGAAFAGLTSSLTLPECAAIKVGTATKVRTCRASGITCLNAVENRTRTVNPSTNEPAAPEDFPKPPNIDKTDNYLEAQALSKKFVETKGQGESKTVAIIGGGLSGLAAAKYLADNGHKPIVLEARDTLGGKVSAWQDEDGDWIETGLHIFFGAYPNMMNIFNELGIEDRLQWKRHQMIFAMQELPGEFTTFDFFEGVPAPLNFALAILLNQKMLTMPEKLQTAPPLLPMLVEGQKFINEQDDMSVLQFMKTYGMPDRINDEVFISMAKALDFIDPDKLSMTVVLTAMNRFLNETDGLQMAFLDGNQPERLCEPMKQHIEARGGEVRLSSPLDKIVVGEDNSVKHLVMRDGAIIEADEYISAVPCDIMKRICPKEWSTMPFFKQIDGLEGIPVINIHLWFDRKLLNVDHLCFSRSPLLSVYADMSTCCKEYHDDDRSMLELVFAPCSPLAGGKIDWLKKSDEEIVEATMKELERLFPTEIGPQLPDGGAKLRKSAVVRVPRSVYAAIPGRNRYRPSQETPIGNFTLAGDWTSQKFLGSMEGAILGGKLAAEVVSDRAAGRATKGLKAIEPHVVEEAAAATPKEPTGVKGNSAIAFGGGAVLSGGSKARTTEMEKDIKVALEPAVA